MSDALTRKLVYTNIFFILSIVVAVLFIGCGAKIVVKDGEVSKLSNQIKQEKNRHLGGFEPCHDDMIDYKKCIGDFSSVQQYMRETGLSVPTDCKIKKEIWKQCVAGKSNLLFYNPFYVYRKQ
jgi:predicted membrane protein